MHAGAGTKQWRGVVEDSQVGEQPVDAAVRGVCIEGRRRVLDGERRTGQVWVRTRRAKSKHGLLRRRRVPQPAQHFADRLVAAAHPSGDLANRDPFGTKPPDMPCPRRRKARPPRRITDAAPQCWQSALLESTLVPAHRPCRALERPRHLELLRPALIDQLDHRVRLGHPVAGGIMRPGDPSHDDDALPALGSHLTPTIDDDETLTEGISHQLQLRLPGNRHDRT